MWGEYKQTPSFGDMSCVHYKQKKKHLSVTRTVLHKKKKKAVKDFIEQKNLVYARTVAWLLWPNTGWKIVTYLGYGEY